MPTHINPNVEMLARKFRGDGFSAVRTRDGEIRIKGFPPFPTPFPHRMYFAKTHKGTLAELVEFGTDTAFPVARRYHWNLKALNKLITAFSTLQNAYQRNEKERQTERRQYEERIQRNERLPGTLHLILDRHDDDRWKDLAKIDEFCDRYEALFESVFVPDKLGRTFISMYAIPKNAKAQRAVMKLVSLYRDHDSLGGLTQGYRAPNKLGGRKGPTAAQKRQIKILVRRLCKAVREVKQLGEVAVPDVAAENKISDPAVLQKYFSFQPRPEPARWAHKIARHLVLNS